MRPLLRVLTVLSFAGFVVAATLAFSVRAAPPGAGTDAGLDAGNRPLLDLLGSTPDRDAMAGSKSFGAPVTPPGFSGFGGLGTGGRELVRPAPRIIDVKISGPQSREAVEREVRHRLGTRFGVEACVFHTGDVNATLATTAAGAVSSVRIEVLGDAGALRGVDCLSTRLAELTLPPLKQPSTITLTLHLERATVR